MIYFVGWVKERSDAPIKKTIANKKRPAIETGICIGAGSFEARLQKNPELMRQRMAIVERPFAILKQIMGFRRFLCWGIESARSEMSLGVLSYNLNRMINREGVPVLLATLR